MSRPRKRQKIWDWKSDAKPDLLLFFDTIIANADRHTGNWMIRDDTKELFAIDHNRTFQFHLAWTWYGRMKTIRDPKDLGLVHERYRTLPASQFREILAPHLSGDEIDLFLKHRSIIIRYLDSAIGDSGHAFRSRSAITRFFSRSPAPSSSARLFSCSPARFPGYA